MPKNAQTVCFPDLLWLKMLCQPVTSLPLVLKDTAVLRSLLDACLDDCNDFTTGGNLLLQDWQLALKALQSS